MMTNPVSSTLAVTEVADRQDKKSDDASKSQAVKADVATSDQVSLTDNARQIGQIVEAASAQADIDAEKVNAIRAELESGTYRIDAERIADGMLGVEEDLGGR